MELTALRYFVTVAKKLHFRQAAAELNITQAPLSAAVKKLEDELETKLFNRTSRSVELTEAGKFFLTEAEAVLNRSAQARKRLRDFVARRHERLAIGYNEPAIHSFLPGVLDSVRRNEPDLRLELRELETFEQWELLRLGKLDIGFMRPLNMDMHGLESKLVLREKYVLAMLETNKLAALEEIDGNDMAGEEIILFARDVNPTAYDHLTASLSANCAVPPHFRQDARNKSSMLAMVSAGFGAALLPESCCGGASDKIVFRNLNIPLPPVDIMAVWDPENTSCALRTFLCYI